MRISHMTCSTNSLQLFHLLHAAKRGGESLFVDGFHAARLLYAQDPAAYHILSTLPVGFMCRGEGQQHLYQPSPTFQPILAHTAGVGMSVGAPDPETLYQVRFNNDDRTLLHPHTGVTGKDHGVTPSSVRIHEFYRALKVWTGILRHPEVEAKIALGPGTVVLLDNWRVLHGRTAFAGYRRMCGCYMGRDEYTSKLALVVGRWRGQFNQN
jgi:trimethyllysine dioxygenase